MDSIIGIGWRYRNLIEGTVLDEMTGQRCDARGASRWSKPAKAGTRRAIGASDGLFHNVSACVQICMVTTKYLVIHFGRIASADNP